MYLRSHPGLRKKLIWTGIVALLFAALLIALPIAVARMAEGWLRDNGAVSAHIDNVDINLFTGEVGVFGLQASTGERERLNIEYAELGLHWWPLVSQRVHVDYLKIADGQIDVVATEEGVWRVGGVTIRPLATAAEADTSDIETSVGAASVWGFGSDLISLRNLQLTYRDALFDSTVDILEIHLGPQFSWDVGRRTSLKIDMSIDGSPILLSSDVLPWAEQRQFSGSLSLDDLDLATHRQVVYELAGLGGLQGTVEFDLQLNAAYASDGALQVQISGPLEIRKAGFVLGDMAISNDSLRWQGQVALNLPVPAGGSLLSIDGELQLAGAEAALRDVELVAELGLLDWQGVVEFSPAQSTDTAMALSVRSTASADGFMLNHERLPFTLAALQTIRADNIEVNGEMQASAGALQLGGLRLLGSPQEDAKSPDVLTLEQLDVKAVTFDSELGLIVETLALLGLNVSVVRNEAGEIERVDETVAVFAGTGGETEAESTGAASDEQEQTSTPLQILVSDIQMQSDALLRFEDRAVTPAAIFKLTDTDLSVKKLDTSGKQAMDVRFNTEGGNLKLTSQGTVNAFAENLLVDLVVQLAGLDLPQLSAYVPAFNLERGRLSADSKISINGDVVDAQNALLIERLQMTAKAAQGNETLGQGMAMPVDVALDLLRDSEDRIKLKLPVTGSLTDPQFGIGDIIRQATAQALQNAAMSYVKNALQPLGALLLVTDLATKAARPRFDPVVMAPGDATLSNTSREYLQKLGGLLTERPGLRLTICGTATPADRLALEELARIEAESAARAAAELPQAMPEGDPAEPTQSRVEPDVVLVTDAQLLELAALRTSTVITFLVSQLGVEQERLFNCREKIEGDGKEPRAEITL